MEQWELKQAIRKQEDEVNRVQPNYHMAVINQKTFIPELPSMDKVALYDIAILYGAKVAGHNPTRATAKEKLIKAITETVNERVDFTKGQYEYELKLLNGLKAQVEEGETVHVSIS